MNILHIKYALEVARLGSLNKAAETLLIAQPNISRSIKELEASLGITIFSRSAKGMELTADGEEFISYAKAILQQIEEVETRYKNQTPKRPRFSVCTPHSYYTAKAFSVLSGAPEAKEAELCYRESFTNKAIEAVANRDFNLGIVRYCTESDSAFKQAFEERSLSYELIGEFCYVLLMSKDNPLAELQAISCDELSKYTEISYCDTSLGALTLPRPLSDELSYIPKGKICVFGRAEAYEALENSPHTFMWASPVDEQLCSKYGLVMHRLEGNTKSFKDMLIHRQNYKLTVLDNLFITALCEARRQCF